MKNFINNLKIKFNRWLYTSWFGVKVLKKKIVPNPLDVGSIRNSPCPCNSGIKIKKCCGKKPYVSEEFAKHIVAIVKKDMQNAN